MPNVFVEKLGNGPDPPLRGWSRPKCENCGNKATQSLSLKETNSMWDDPPMCNYVCNMSKCYAKIIEYLAVAEVVDG